MRSLMKRGVGVLLVGGLMVSGLGVFSAGEGSVKTAEAAVTNPSAGSLTYDKNLGDTEKYGKSRYIKLHTKARGVVNASRTGANSRLVIENRVNPKEMPAGYYMITYYKKSSKGKFEKYGVSTAVAYSATYVDRKLPSGSYYAVIKRLPYDSRLAVYETVTKKFYHSDKLK